MEANVKMTLNIDARTRAHLMRHIPSDDLVGYIRDMLQSYGHDFTRDVLVVRYGLYKDDAEEIVVEIEQGSKP